MQPRCHLDHGQLPHSALGALVRNTATGERFVLLDPVTTGTKMHGTVLSALATSAPTPCACGLLVGRLAELEQV